jgi:DnaD/phage-associated family protein
VKINEVKNNTFYQFPQWLLDEDFKELSLRSKIVYMLIFDRRSYSMKNNWYDKNGDVYVYFPIEEFMKVLSCSRQSIVNAKKELVEIGLIKEVRQGVNKPNRLYINGSLENRPQDVQKLDAGSLENRPQDVQKLDAGSLENRPQDVQKLDGIKTKYIKTNITNINNDDDRPQKLENIQSGTIAQTLRSRGFKLDQIQFQQLFDYIALDGMNIELVQLAISKSADNEARNFRYLKSILDNWKKNGVTTVEEAEKADEKYKSSKKPKTYNGQKDFKSGKYALLGTDISVHEIDPELGF